MLLYIIFVATFILSPFTFFKLPKVNLDLRKSSLPLAVLLVSLSFSCDDKGESEKSTPKLASSGKRTEVSTAVAVKKPFEYIIYTRGKMIPLRQVKLHFEKQGILESKNITNGQWVKKGATIATLRSGNNELAIEDAELTLKEKEIAYEDLLVQYTGVHDDDSLNSSAILQSLAIKSGYARAKLALREAIFNKKTTFLKAPMSGVIAGMDIEPGDMANTQDPVCVIYDPRGMGVKCQILEDDLTEVALGRKAIISLSGEGSEELLAQVIEIDPIVNNEGLINMMLKIHEYDKKMYPGAHVGVAIHSPKNQNIIVPKKAVVIRSGKKVVFTVENSLAKWNYVTTGLENGKEIEVLEGLKVDQSVIITNNLQLAHDAPVEVIN